MATLVPIYQRFFPAYFGRIVSVTKVQLVSTSDSFTLPIGVVVNGSPAVRAIRNQNEEQISSCSQSSSTGVVTMNSSADKIGKTVTVVGLHEDRNSSSVG